jgi:U3 small nucleolar ribonucleoprotein protein IMP3
VGYVFKSFHVFEEGSDCTKSSSSSLNSYAANPYQPRANAPLPQSLRQLAHKLAALPSTDPIRLKHETLLLSKLYDLGLLPTTSKLSAVENSVTVSAFARRRLPVVLTRLRMAETVQAATTIIEQGHVRVGTEAVTDPAYLVTRGMEDFVTWVDGSRIRRNILKYREKLDDFDLL